MGGGGTAPREAGQRREEGWHDRQSEINGDGQKKVTTEGEAECENVSVAERMSKREAERD